MSDIDEELLALAGGNEDVDVEEGEASSVAASSPNSLGSDAMDESDSDREEGEAPDLDTSVPYPLEGKYIDQKDKARVLAMSQLEREKELGDRAEEMTKARLNAELARRAANIQNDKKRKADSEEPEDLPNRSSKQKVKKGLEALKQAREQRGLQRGQQRAPQDDRRGRSRRSSSGDRAGRSDVDADGDSDVDWAEEAKQAAREEQPAMLHHFEQIRVGRGFFSKVCYWPGFEEAMTGAFGRVGVGQDAQRRTLYKMAQITGFTTGRPYIFEGKDGQRLATDQYVVARHGNIKKEYQFHFLSNQRFSESDLDQYKQALSEAGAKFPTQTTLRKKYNEMHDFENRFWTDADINARIANAQKHKDFLRSKTAKSDGPRLATQTEVAANRLAELNRQNRKREQERVRQALLDERRAQHKERKRQEEAAKKKAAEEEAAKKAAEEKAKSKNLLEVDALFDGDSSRASTPKPQEQKKKKPVERKGMPTFRKPKMEDDIIAAMDFEVNVDIGI